MRPLQLVDEAERASTLLHPTRMALLEALESPASPVDLAERLEQPRQRLGYHLRELERGGFIEVATEERRGSVIERTYRRTAQSYMISPAVMGDLAATPEFEDRFSAAYLCALAGRTLSEVGALSKGAAEAKQKLVTLSLDGVVRLANPEQRAAFADELQTVLLNLIEKYHSPEAEDGREYRLALGAYPKPKPGATGSNTEPN